MRRTDFLGTEEGFSTIPCVISPLAKREDITVADHDIDFVIQKGLQFSCSAVRWFENNDLRNLEDVLLSVEKEQWKLHARRFIVTEGILNKDVAMVDFSQNS